MDLLELFFVIFVSCLALFCAVKVFVTLLDHYRLDRILNDESYYESDDESVEGDKDAK